MSDADPQSPELIAHLRGDIPYAVVTRSAPTLPQLDDAGRKIQVVVRDEYRLDRNLVEIGHALDRAAAAIHEAHGLQQPQLGVAEPHLRKLALVARLTPEYAAQAAGQLVDEPEPGIVPRARVFGPGVAETDNQLERHT